MSLKNTILKICTNFKTARTDDMFLYKKYLETTKVSPNASFTEVASASRKGIISPVTSVSAMRRKIRFW